MVVSLAMEITLKPLLITKEAEIFNCIKEETKTVRGISFWEAPLLESLSEWHLDQTTHHLWVSERPT
jgi:hypothetical protein